MANEIASASQESGLLNFIERASRDPEFDVAKFEALLRMQREIVSEQARREFNQAMAAAQTEMMPIIRDATNTHTGSKYAKLETIDRAMRPIYTSHGFAVRFGSEPSAHEGWIRIVCTVSHTGGYSETNYLDAPPDVGGSQGRSNKTPIQGVGATVTYLRRYLLAMVFNIVLADDDEDDDGQRKPETTGPRNHRGNGAGKPLEPLDEPNGTIWLRNLSGLLDRAQARQDVVDLRGDPRVTRVLEARGTPKLIKGQIEDLFKRAFDRMTATAEDEAEASVEHPDEPPADWSDPIAELLAEVEGMDEIAINGLATNAAWRARVRDVAGFPPDEDRLNEAIANRKATLQQGRGKHVGT